MEVGLPSHQPCAELSCRNSGLMRHPRCDNARTSSCSASVRNAVSLPLAYGNAGGSRWASKSLGVWTLKVTSSRTSRSHWCASAKLPSGLRTLPHLRITSASISIHVITSASRGVLSVVYIKTAEAGHCIAHTPAPIASARAAAEGPPAPSRC
eukprot:6176048-Pleurochrysis_carterae.AAC.4